MTLNIWWQRKVTHIGPNQHLKAVGLLKYVSTFVTTRHWRVKFLKKKWFFETFIPPAYTLSHVFSQYIKQIFINLRHLNQDRPVYYDSPGAFYHFRKFFKSPLFNKTLTGYSEPKSKLLKTSEIFNSQIAENVQSRSQYIFSL